MMKPTAIVKSVFVFFFSVVTLLSIQLQLQQPPIHLNIFIKLCKALAYNFTLMNCKCIPQVKTCKNLFSELWIFVVQDSWQETAVKGFKPVSFGSEFYPKLEKGNSCMHPRISGPTYWLTS